LQFDSAENQYTGDSEKVTEEEFHIAAMLNTKKLIRAYAV